MAEKRDILVTGGSGFVGTAVIRQLLARGRRVVATSNVVTASMTEQPGLAWVIWDALAEPLPKIAWDNIGCILHLAMPEKFFDFPAHAPAIYELAAACTFRLLETARTRGIGRMVIASTGNVLGHRQDPAREDDVCYEPESFYGATKACAELLMRAYQPILPTAILRFYHPYGPGGERFLVNRMLRAVAQGQEIQIDGDNGVMVNPVWIDDMADGVCATIESDAPGIFHLGGPEVLNLRQLITLAGEVLGKAPIIRCRPKDRLEQHAASCDIARRVLGYDPRVGVREGLARLARDMTPSGRKDAT